MSGDVQPRKRKDKKKKKDDLSLEESGPRGTAAALGEGDVFMHSQHDHGTGGHWCAKLIFFSLLAILMGLIGLIILENRGLSELEANAVESRYSGILEGWIEDAPDDDHHDAHTLELNHHDDEHEDDDHDDDDEDDEIEVEKIEKEASEDEEPISTELPALPEEGDDDDDGDDKDDDKDDDDNGSPEGDDGDDDDASEGADDDNDDGDDKDDDGDEDFLDNDEVVERITAPAGKPFKEVEEDEASSEKPTNTLDEEEEYEKQQEEMRREEEQSSHKDGGNSVEDRWPGEPSDSFWRQQLDSAEQYLRQGAWSDAAALVTSPELTNSGRARYIAATALDRLAEAKRDNNILFRAITAYLHLLKMNENLSDKKLVQVAKRALDRIQFRGSYLSAEPVYRLLIRRFPDEPAYRNNLTIAFLMSNRNDLAEEVLKETLLRWPNDKVALVHHAFVLKTLHNKNEEAVVAFEKALKGDKGPACEPRFYYHYGDALLLLGRHKEALEVHKRGAKYGHFLSPSQRSLYNVPRLKGKPWWNVEETPYVNLAKALEKSWKDILREGEAAKASYEKEKEGLKEKGEWTQLDLFVRGAEIPGRCDKAPVTCSIIRTEPGAARCRRGQVKFSLMRAGTHVRAHVGPTNCRLRMHLGLSNTKDTYLRVDQETRQWQEGKVLVFDDSFEHEVWHNGTGPRLVLIVDVWHPGLTAAEKRDLPPI